MGTTSSIVLRRANDSIGIYCNWDGYPEHHLPILTEHYNTEEKLLGLIALGNLSSLYPNINPSGAHNWKDPEPGVVVAYTRDRGENWMYHIPFTIGKTDKIKSTDYSYYFDGKWTYECNQ